jgi:hypothetical protein
MFRKFRTRTIGQHVHLRSTASPPVARTARKTRRNNMLWYQI